jgi:hypothetical protein
MRPPVSPEFQPLRRKEVEPNPRPSCKLGEPKRAPDSFGFPDGHLTQNGMST